MTTKEKIIEILKCHIIVSNSNHTCNKKIHLIYTLGNLGLDSIDVVEFTMDIESEFNISFGDFVFKKGHSVNEIITLVEYELKNTNEKLKELHR